MLRKNNRNVYIKGQWNVICDRCGFKKKSGEVKMEWDNLLVCKDKCWEPRQPQDLIRGVPDMRPVPIARPEAEDQFITTPVTSEDL